MKQISEDILVASIRLIEQSEGPKFKNYISLFIELVQEFIKNSPDSPLGQNVIDALNILVNGRRNDIKGCGDRFEQEEWEMYIQTICILFQDTMPTFLVETNSDDGLEDIKDEEL